MTVADTPTVVELHLDQVADEIDQEARRAAVAEWNQLPPTRQAHAAFDAILDRQRARLARKRTRAAEGG